MNLKGYPSLSKKDYLSKVIEPLMSYNKDITLDYLKIILLQFMMM